jgi:serine phosphatase RsbU (regulator of sigma subunit)
MRRRREWALSYDEPRASVLIAAVLYLVGAALTATAALDPHVRSPAGVAAIAAVACVTALALLLAARRPLEGFTIAFAADIWGVVLIALLCAATAGAMSPFALLYFFAICHAAAFQPSRRFAFVSVLALAAFLAPLVYDGVPTGFAPFAIVGVILALLISCVIHFALAGLRAQRRRLQLMIAASAKLDISLDPSQTLRQMAHSAVPELAELCVIDIVERDGGMECVAAASDPSLASRVEAMRREAPQSDTHTRLMHEAGYRAAAVFPLRARNRTHGEIAFLRVGEQNDYSDHELGVLEELASRAALAYDNARLYAERARVASALQRSLMPPRLPEVKWLELASYFRPIGAANQIGGDFYDAFMGERESCWLVVGDVCGKGPQAAAYTGLLRQSTRAYAREATSPAAVLAQVNQAMLEQDFEEGFATAVLVLLRLDGERIDATVAAAGHPPAVVIRAEGGTEELGSGQLLGRFEDARVQDERTVLRVGDALALYTDGLSEAHAPQRMHSVAELTAPLRARAARSAQDVLDALLAPVGADEGRDDIAILTALARAAERERPESRSAGGRSRARGSARLSSPPRSIACGENAPSPLRAEGGGE